MEHNNNEFNPMDNYNNDNTNEIKASKPARINSPRTNSRFKSTVAAFLAGTLVTGGLMFASDKMNLFTAYQGVMHGSTAAVATTGSGSSATLGGIEKASVDPGTATGSIAQIAKQASPAVVKIETKVKARTNNSAMNDPLFRQFFGGGSSSNDSGGDSGELQDGGLGTGFIFDKAGYILTNEHVIDGAEEIWVTVQGYDKPFKATLLGNSYDLDLAALKIEGDKDFPSLPLGNPDDTKVGDWVVAIGNPYGFDQTVTEGVLSAKERPITIPDEQGTREYKHLLQTDASINPGNSGGPLLNMNGEVIGINTAVNAEAQGIGFAIPTSTVATVLENLKNNKPIPKTPSPYIGVGLEDIDDSWVSDLKLSSKDGAIVSQIEPKSPAFAAGIREYDVITAVNGEKVANSDELSTKIKAQQVGSTIKVTISRNGQQSDVSVTVGDKNNSSAQK
ncbi:S1C family serine protease [Paenibacillus cremeus]|nr:trypsin-like peptidase domain-containing protein [Paenibacillus cremeus]